MLVRRNHLESGQVVKMSSASQHQSSYLDPFNHYHTEFVKLDANNWQEAPMSDSAMSRDGVQQFVQVFPNDDIVDSINVTVDPNRHDQKSLE